MPRGSPFTQLCAELARVSQPITADLHLHTTASDGDFTSSQLVAMAQAKKLKCIAITDHDTLADQPDFPGVEIIPAVEFSALWNGREWHILGYFLDRSSPALQEHLSNICTLRRKRFTKFVDAFQSRGAKFPNGVVELTMQKSESLGRRHLMKLLIDTNQVKHRHEAFSEWIGPAMEQIPARHLTDAQTVINLIHHAGGVASLAHPPSDITAETLAQFQKLDLDCVEVRYPASGKGNSARLEQIAQNLGLGITAGSDCHGSELAGRFVGCCGLKAFELDRLRQLCGTARTNHLPTGK
jgi:3',5'-nucleoside bisphosphate phosphatase